MNPDLLSRLVTLGVFGAAGWALAKRWRLPVTSRTWLLLVVAVCVGAFVGVNTNVVCLAGIGLCIRLNWAIASCCLGLLAGLWLRARASSKGGQS